MINDIEKYIKDIEYVVYKNDETNTIIRWAVITLKNDLVMTGAPRLNTITDDDEEGNTRVAYLNALLSVNEYFRCLEKTLESEDLIFQ